MFLKGQLIKTRYLGILNLSQNTHCLYKKRQYICFNWTYFTCSYVKWVWDISQYNKPSDFNMQDSWRWLCTFILDYLVSWYPHYENQKSQVITKQVRVWVDIERGLKENIFSICFNYCLVKLVGLCCYYNCLSHIKCIDHATILSCLDLHGVFPKPFVVDIVQTCYIVKVKKHVVHHVQDVSTHSTDLALSESHSGS